MASRLLRNAILSIVPSWMSNRPGLNNIFKVLYAVALVGDCFLEQGWEGLQATFPGVGTPTANPLLGAERGLIQGPYETAANFVTRLLGYLNDAQNLASDEVLLHQLQAYLTETDTVTKPQIRLVNRAGHFTTISPTGVFTKTIDATWGPLWDGTLNPERSIWWSDIWVIIYPAPPQWPIYASTADANYLAAWAAKQLGIGHGCDRRSVSDIRQLVGFTKGPHCYLKAIIWSTDPSLFIPGALGLAGNPNGKWTHWGATNAAGKKLPIRTTATGGGTVRYWTPETLAD